MAHSFSCRLYHRYVSIKTYCIISFAMAKKVTDLGETMSEWQQFTKIKVGLPPSYDPLLHVWDNVPIAE